MATRFATTAAQKVVKTSQPDLVVDGVWGRKSEKAFVSSPASVQAAAEQASEALGYKLSAIRDAARGKSNSSIGGAGFDLVLKEARKAGISGESLLFFMTSIQAESRFVNQAEKGYSYEGALKQFGARMAPLVGKTNASAVDIANTVYATSGGNSLPGDGWKYRGRGYIQLTGRANYSDFGQAYGYDVVQNPDLISSNDLIAAQAAIWFWKTRVRARGKDTDMHQVTLAVNGAKSKKSGERIAMLPQMMQAIA